MSTVIGVEFIATANFSQLMTQVSAANAQLAALSGEQLKMAAASRAAAMSMFSANITAGGAFSTSMAAVQGSVATFGSALMNNKLKLQDYKRHLGDFYNANARGSSMIQNLARQNVRMAQSIVLPAGFNKAGQQMAQVITNNGRMVHDAGYQAAMAAERMKVLNRVMMNGSTAIVNWGKNTQWAGRQMMVGLTMPLVIIGALAAKTFYDFNKELTRFIKVYGQGASQLSKEAILAMREEVTGIAKELAKSYGTPMKDTAELAAMMGAAGYEGEKLTGALRDVSRLSILGAVDAETAWKTYLSLQTTFNQNTKEMTENIDYFSGVESATSLSLQDITAAIPRAAPVVKALGGDIQQLTTYMVAMREGGVPAAEAANTLKTSLARLIAPTRQTKEVFKSFGIDIVKIVNDNKNNINGAIFSLQAALDDLNPLQRAQAINQAFGKQRFANITALFNNLGREGSQSAIAIEFATLSAGQRAVIAARELYEVQNTASTKFKRALGEIQSGLLKFGERFLGILTVVAKGVGMFINALERLPSGLKSFLLLGTITAAIVGPIIMLTGVFGNFVGYLIKGLVHLRMFASGSKNNLQLMTAEMVANNDFSSQAARNAQRRIDSNAVLAASLKKLADELMLIANAEKVVEARAVSMGAALTTAASSGAGRAAGAAVAGSVAASAGGSAATAAATARVASLGASSGVAAAEGTYASTRLAMAERLVRAMAAEQTQETVLGKAYFALTSAQENYAKEVSSFTVRNAQSAARIDQAALYLAEAETNYANVIRRVATAEVARADKKIAADAAMASLQREEAVAKMSVILSAEKSSAAAQLIAIKTISRYLPAIDQQIISTQGLTDAQIIERLKIQHKIATTDGLTAEQQKLMLEYKIEQSALVEQIISTKGLTAQKKLLMLSSSGELTAQELLIAADIELGTAEKRLAAILRLRGMTPANVAPNAVQPGALAGKVMMPAMGAGMAMTMGSMATKGTLQQGLMYGGMAVMFAPMLLQIKAVEAGLVRLGAGMATLAGKAGIAGVAMRTMGALGAAAISPIGLAAIAVGISIFAISKAMDNAQKKTESFRAAGDAMVTLLDGRIKKLVMSTNNLSDSIDATSRKYEEAKRVIDLLPDESPIKKFIDDIKSEANAGASIPKKIAAMYAEGILAGVDPEALKQNLQIALDMAGQGKYTMAVKLRIDKINIENKQSIYDAMFGDGLDISKNKPNRSKDIKGLREEVDAKRKIIIDYAEKNKVNMIDYIVEEGYFGDKAQSTKFFEDELKNLKNNPLSDSSVLFDAIGGAVPFAISDVSDSLAVLSADLSNVAYLGGKDLTDFASNLLTVATSLQAADPTTLNASFKELSNNSLLTSQYSTNIAAVQKSIVDQSGLNVEYQDLLLDSSLSMTEFMQSTLLAANGLSPALIAAARSAGTLSTVLAFTQSINLIPQADEDELSKKAGVKSGSTSGLDGGGKGGARSDPYKSQKDANTKRIDQEKEIIKAIEKKRDAEKKAFDEKKRQNDYLKNQADSEIKYREALASGDFGAAAMAKNQMISDQNTKAADDAQRRKEDAFQAQIDKHQGNIDNIEKANKGLDALSQKASQAAAAVSTTAETSYTKVHDVYDTLMEDSKNQGFRNAADMQAAYPKVARKIAELEGDVKGFFDYAFEQHKEGLTASIISSGLTSRETAAELALLGAAGTDLAAIAAETDPSKRVEKIEAYIKGLVRSKGIPWEMTGLSVSGTGTPVATPNFNGDDGVTIGVGGIPHDGGLIQPGMKSSRLGRTLRGPIGSDEMLVLAQHGEYMINASAAGIIGRNNLDAINNGKLPAVPVAGGGGGANYSFTVNASPGQDARQIAQEVQRIFQINERRKGGART